MTKSPPQIYRVIPKSEQPPNPLDGAELQLICALKDSILWSLRESQSPGAEVEVAVVLKVDEFHIEQRLSVRKAQYNWGETINRRACPRKRMSPTIDDEQARLDHALAMVRQELNTLPLLDHLSAKSSLRMILGFTEGRIKCCEVSRVRSALGGQ